IERTPDSLYSELQEELLQVCNVWASFSTIHRTLQRRGWSRKKITRPAQERDEEDVAAFQMLIGQYYQPEQLVFCDES
ncbi:hypothetical protein K435DRAFT_602312, partial [Dendrothele bispora CBS 962.96]